jgi:plasmid replication initiation protein
MNIQSKNVIIKSNRLIEAGYKLSLQEQRVILYCIAKINSKDKLENKTFRISAQEYADTFDIKLNNAYKELKQVIDNLYSRSIKLYDREENIEAEIRWIQDKYYFNNEGLAQITLTSGVAPLLSELQSYFTSYDLENIAGMRSIYAIRLYELFKQFGSIGRRKLKIDWLKERLHISEIYSAFADLKKRVIEPALKEINQHSDLTVAYKPIKQSRKVVEIEFSFSKKEKSLQIEKLVGHEKDKKANVDLLKELMHLGITEKQGYKLVGEYGEEKVQKGINITNHNLEKNLIKKSVSGFLINAIKNDYTSYEINKTKESLNKTDKLKKIEEINLNLEDFSKMYDKFILNYVEQKINNFSLQRKKEYIKLFLEQADDYTLGKYHRGGLENRTVYVMFLSFMKTQIDIPSKQSFFIENGIAVENLLSELDVLQQANS